MNVLIVGLGSIGQKHIKALKAISPDISIYALRSQTSAEQVVGVTNLFELTQIDGLHLDFVIISNPTADHKKTIEELIKYNIPLFIEKPLFHNLDGGDLLKQIKENKIVTYVACNLRFLDSIVFTKKFIAGKRINEVNSYCGSYLPDWRPGLNYKESYSVNTEMGGGVHLDLIHEIDYLYWMLGAPEKSRSIKRSKSSLNISAVDYANYNLIYPDYCANIILNYYRKDKRRDLEILLDEGTLQTDLLKNEVKLNGELIFSSVKNIAHSYVDQLQFFIYSVIGKNEQFNDINEAFEVLQICLKDA